uniref:Uncharacterized protein n=1 Tax=Amphimedon queenslandica TaxID=400682 RepID=A0A1X7UVK1_AMPQE
NYEKLEAKVADNEVYITKLLEEKTQVEEKKQVISEEYEKLKAKVEEQYPEEKQVITDLKEKELYIAKLVKEKQERGKETSSIGLQFNYLIPSMDNLDCLSDVQVAEKKLFLVQGEKPQLINWEKYGLRIGVQEDTLSSTDTVEVAVVALLGGQFIFPKNTVLVSAVYAVSVSKPLLKPLRLEIEHCINLRGQPGLTRFLKFAIAPVSTPSLPYQFSVIEGGEFKADSWYGSIQRKKFCLVAIVGEKFLSKSSTNGDESEEVEEEEEQTEEETEEEVEDGDSDSSSDSDKTKDPPGGSSRGQGDWISPTVTGDRPSPISSFTLTSIDDSSAILFGGDTANGRSNNVYILNFTDTSVFNTPKNVTNRCWHSLSVWSVTQTTNWIIEFGGATPYTDTAVIELRYTSDNDWSTSVIPLDQYQEKLQERRREWEASQPVQPEDRREIDQDYEKLKLKVAELLEEKEEQYLKEKQIII